MPLKTASSHKDRFIVKTEVSIPWNPAVKNNPVVKSNIRSQNSITDNEKQKYCQFGIGGWENQFKKMDKFCFDIRHCQIFCKSKIKKPPKLVVIEVCINVVIV